MVLPALLAETAVVLFLGPAVVGEAKEILLLAQEGGLVGVLGVAAEPLR